MTAHARAASPPPGALLAGLEVGRALADQPVLAALAIHCPADCGAAVVEGIADDIGLAVQLRLGATAVQVEIAPRAADRPFAIEVAGYTLSWHARGAIDESAGRALCQILAALVASRGDAGPAVDADGRGLRLRQGGPLLTRVAAPGPAFDALSPYVGCAIGCRFCYAGERAGAWWAHRHGPAPWGSWVEARVDAAEQLERELVGRPPRPIKLTPIASDPWHGPERRLRLTRACLQVLARTVPAVPVIALSRSPYVLDDLATLAAMPAVWVGVSLPTLDDEVRRHFEPRAASVEQRLATLQALRRQGVRAFAVVQPMLPGPIDALCDAIAAHCDSASLDVLRGLYAAGADFRGPFAAVATGAWQQARSLALRQGLQRRGVPLWQGELPPELERALAQGA